MKKLFIHIPKNGGVTIRESAIFQDKIVPVNKKWISDYIGKKCNFVFMPNHSNRMVDQDYAFGKNQVAFSDGFPLLLISESSLNDLNGRISEEINDFLTKHDIRSCLKKVK